MNSLLDTLIKIAVKLNGSNQGLDSRLPDSNISKYYNGYGRLTARLMKKLQTGLDRLRDYLLARNPGNKAAADILEWIYNLREYVQIIALSSKNLSLFMSKDFQKLLKPMQEERSKWIVWALLDSDDFNRKRHYNINILYGGSVIEIPLSVLPNLYTL